MSGQSSPFVASASGWLRRLLAGSLILSTLAGVSPRPVHATNFAVVVNMNDGNAPANNSDIIHPGPGGCSATGTGTCSLRDAILFANSKAANDTTVVTLPAGSYTLRLAGVTENAAMTGDLDILRNVVINGAGAGVTFVQASTTGSAAGAIDRVFEVGFGTSISAATINGVTERYGGNPGNTGAAGGIVVETAGSTLTLNDSVVSDNASSMTGEGGGIYLQPAASLIVNRSTIRSNVSAGKGGGIYNDHGAVTVVNSTIVGNHGDTGGGIYNNGGTSTVTNSTVVGNTSANGGGGGLRVQDGTARVTNTTFVSNTANGFGGGLYNQAIVIAINSLFANNVGSYGGPDVAATFGAGSINNLVSNGQLVYGVTDGANGNIIGHPALVDTVLRDNGTTNGTQTLALLPGSLAINGGDPSACAAASPGGAGGFDQRGVARPQPSGGQCDIGAFEYVFASTTTALTSSTNPSTFGQSVTLTAKVSGSGGAPTGSVTFRDGSTALATDPLAGGASTFTTTSLGVGAHAITATYNGDSAFAPSAGTVAQVVNPASGGGSPTPGLQFYPIASPIRLLDTRPGQVAVVNPGVPLAPNQPLSLPGQFSSGAISVPAGALALVGNATVDNSAGAPAGFATLFPSGSTLPLASNLNFVPGTVRPNAFTVVLGADGRFNLQSSTGGDFIIDITGYYAPPSASGLYFHPLSAPVRLLDTRSGQVAVIHPGAALTAGQTLNLPGQFTATGVTVPSSARALAGNATVDDTINAPAGFATIFPGGTNLPPTSSLNFASGTVAPNAFTVGLGADGSFNLFSSTGGNFIVDVTGYYDNVASGGLEFYPLSQPTRELDTRPGQPAFVHPNVPLPANGTLSLPASFTFAGATVPASANALVGNATVDNSINVQDGFATVFPGGTTLPLASNLNYSKGTVAPNAFIVGVGSDGTYDLYSLSGGNFIIDISGYFAASTG